MRQSRSWRRKEHSLQVARSKRSPSWVSALLALPCAWCNAAINYLPTSRLCDPGSDGGFFLESGVENMSLLELVHDGLLYPREARK